MGITVHRFSDNWRSAWEAFIERMPMATLAHTPQWLSVLSQALGHQDRSLIAERDGEVCGILPILLLQHWLFGTFYASLPWLDYGGIIAEDPETSHNLVEAAVAHARVDRASWIEFRSVNQVHPDMPTRSDKVTFLLELGDVESVWRRLEPQVRTKLRKAQKAGLRCQFGREELLPEFYRVFARNMRDLGTPVWGVTLFESILRAFPKTAEIALIRLEDKTIGGGLVFYFHDTVDILSSSSLRPYFHLAPNNLLNWEVIKRACDAGYRTFDFGRSTVGSGTYQFKKQWGTRVKPLHWQYVLLEGKEIPKLNPSNPRFIFFIEAWKRLPLPVANWLGPRIVRHLP